MGVCARLCCADASTLAHVEQQLWAHTAAVLFVMFSPDGTRIVSGSTDNTIKLWGTRPFLMRVRMCCWRCKGPWAAAEGCVHWRLRRADSSTLALVAEHASAHTDMVLSLDFSPDGMRIVSGSADLHIKLWGETNR